MKKAGQKTILVFLGIAVILSLITFGILQWYKSRIAALPYYGQSYTIQTSAPYYKVDAFSFINQDSTVVTSEFVKNKIWVANYFYTTCGSICPKMIAGMGYIQATFKDNNNIRLTSFTVDPEQDTPERLKDYAATRNIDTRQWQFLSGSKKELYRYGRKSLFITASDGSGNAGDFIHSDKLVLIDREGHIRGYYDGTEPADVKQLTRDINKLLNN